MAAEKPTYDELEAKLAEVEKMINTVRNDQTNAVLTKKIIYLMRLKKMKEVFRKSKDELKIQVADRTAELKKSNEELRREIEKRKKFEADLRTQGEKILAAYRQRNYLSQRLVELLERERREIGRTLHDQIGQIFSGIFLQLETLKDIRTEDGSVLADRVEPIQDILKEGITQTRHISHFLRSDVLERYGLVTSLKSLAEEVQKQSDLKIYLFTKNIPQTLKEGGKDLTIYRVLQESLTNIVKHAGAQEVFINLTRRDSCVFLSIEDDGKGFDHDMLVDKESFDSPLGIAIMRERVSMIGGVFRIESAPGRGTHILAEIPLGQPSVENVLANMVTSEI